ncbi:hypothetical protein AAG570_005329 [Ranatra chinensis]|uniref:Elongation of very long chain fatty acids protein n=1 Tax=Ranatra chinensis TaxID=642074 RepID=A0ABD0Y2K1_9HEMI
MECSTTFFFDLADPRTNDWPLLTSPLPGLGIIGFYLYFVTSLGPRMMANRKPYNLNNILVVYNALQVALSSWIVYESLEVLVFSNRFSFRCEPVNWEKNPETMRIARGFYVYFWAKITELLDTVFFVLRKKQSQVTFLHVYHHTTMPMISWGAAKYYPGGHGAFVGFINSFVHIVMYTYYMLAAMGPNYQKFLWWKKHITILQLVQFCLAFVHSMQLLFTDCDYPKWSVLFVMPNSVFFYYLFSDFYRKTYCTNNNNNDDEQKKSLIKVD